MLWFLIICRAFFFCWIIIFLYVYILWLILKWFFFYKIFKMYSWPILIFVLYMIFFGSNCGWWNATYVDLFYNGRWDDNYCNSSVGGRIFVIHSCCTSPPLVQLSIVNPCHKKKKQLMMRQMWKGDKCGRETESNCFC